MTLTKVKLERFTAFSELEVEFSLGINVFIGANGTGKTHLMKACYAACDVARTGDSFVDKLVRVFLPSGRVIGRLVKRQQGRNAGTLAVHRADGRILKARFSSSQSAKPELTGATRWTDPKLESAYVPVKDMLSNAPGFRSLYAARDIHFEEVYVDILNRAYRPVLRGPMDSQRRKLVRLLRDGMQGTVIESREEFFLKSKQGNIEFTLLAEGMRKLALLWLLIQNGTLSNGSVLFWDEPETNLNPRLFRTIVGVLLELQRQGVQVFLATHDYVILEELDLQVRDSDQLRFHSLYHKGDSEIAVHSVDNYLGISPNAIADTFNDLYDRNIARSLGGR